ncbi:MAG TPA: argininosuccinate lyase [Anaerolineae bacterium]|nr:argininosuccinate lyase [Anaerolineae bacterium]
MTLWGGRFTENLNQLAAELNNSLPFDWRLAEVDVRGSIAWAQAIAKAGVITADEGAQLVAGLQQILDEVRNGRLDFNTNDEDIHSLVERRLGEIVGSVAGKLHTGRSRNDQVATDFRLWLMETIDQIDQQLHALQATLVDRAETDWGVNLPGYTHFQRAQPIALSHWWLSHVWALRRDRERLTQARQRTAVLPLGSGALAGTPFAIDRLWLAQELGFNEISLNSLDAVSDRDFAAEFLFAAALIGVHLSRLAEALIVYSTAEYGFIELADAFSTGSSLMPQKKNPDPLELARGKAGTLIGQLTGLLATMKSLPSAYDKDLQEDKPPVFEAANTLLRMLPVTAGAIRTLSVKADRMQAALDPAMLATDLADYAVARDVPFREAHALAGRAVRRAIELGIKLDQLPVRELQAINPVFDQDVATVFDFQAAIDRRNSIGGTGSAAVRAQLEQAKNYLARSAVNKGDHHEQ